MRILRRPKFVDDITDAYAWIAGESPRTAHRLLDEIEAVVGLLQEYPEIGRQRDELRPGVRSFRIDRFRHVVFYRLESDVVILLRLIHGARDMDRQEVD